MNVSYTVSLPSSSIGGESGALPNGATGDGRVREGRTVDEEEIRNAPRHVSLAQHDEAVVLPLCCTRRGACHDGDVRLPSRRHRDQPR